MQHGKDFYTVGGFSSLRCPGSLIGHNMNCCRVEWTHTMGKQRVGWLVCLNCGDRIRAIEYASKARRR